MDLLAGENFSPFVSTERMLHLHRQILASSRRPSELLSMIGRAGLRAGSQVCIASVAHRSLSTAAPQTIQSLLFPKQSSLKEGDVCSVNGWVRSVRTQKHVAFVALGDGTTLNPLQVVLRPDQADG